jgi:uncharacterized protein (TIGR02118 family)
LGHYTLAILKGLRDHDLNQSIARAHPIWKRKVKIVVKFMVVLYKRSDLDTTSFEKYLLDVHGPLALKVPGLKRCIYNLVASDPRRKHPGWHAIVELYFDDWDSMERAWASPEGQAVTNDLEAFTDLSRTTWSVTEEKILKA